MTSLHRMLTRMTAALAAAALTACGPSDPPQAREDQARTHATDAGGATAATDPAGGPADNSGPSADAEILHNVFEFPGQPQVLWTEEPLGTPDDDDRSVPGPTDYAYDAVLDYGDPAAVAELVTGLTPVPSLLADVPAWYPPAVADAAGDAGVVLDIYTGVPGFGPQQEVGVVANEPRYVLLRHTTT
ncbi:MAG: hypothetical protein R2761_09155 [Acidimicrobiales bacterium]